MSRKSRYAMVFVVAILLANVYTFWPALVYGNPTIECPAIFASVSYQITGSSLVVGPPLYSYEQFLLSQGSIAYEAVSYNSTNDHNNLTRTLNFPPSSSPDSFFHLYQLDPLSGGEQGIPMNQTGVTIAYQNITFQGIYFAKVVYKISVSSSARSASYELGSSICGGTGLIMTIGSIPYGGPLDYGQIQLADILINNAIAVIVASGVCVFLRYYWYPRGEKKPAKKMLEII